jgi:glycosyltransferase involved in cell wall biosynthesis
VEDWLRKENVTPIAMAPNGVRAMERKGIECEYVPHGIDTKIFKPTAKIQGTPVREFMGLTDEFLVGMNAANKSSGLVHRKSFSENLLAFSIFRQRHPDAVLYLHTEPLGNAGGWNLINLLQGFGIPKEAVLFPPMVDYKYGMSQADLAALYSAMDVLLAPGMGEGFGLPTVEAQSCGTRVIGSNWGATPDLVAEDSWLIEGQPTWDAGQNAVWTTPLVPSIVNALELAYKADRGPSQIAMDFAKQFDVDTVWDKYWLPVMQKLLK